MADLEEELVAAVGALEVVRVQQLLAQGVCLNFLPAGGPPPLHAVLGHAGPEDGRQLALAQLLLLGGADPALPDARGRTALEVAVAGGKEELVQLVRAWGGAPGGGVVDTPSVTFHRYVFEEGEEELPPRETLVPSVPPTTSTTPTTSKNFLERVAEIFQPGVAGSPVGAPDGEGEGLGEVYDQLATVGLSTPVRRPPAAARQFRCSTPRRRAGGRLDISTISSIHSLHPSTVVDRLEEQLEVPCSDSSSSASFLTCEDSVGLVASGLAASRLAVGEELLHTDPAASVSLVEHRRPSLLALALADQQVLEQLQEQAEQSTGHRSLLASSTSSSLHRTFVLERSKSAAREEEVEVRGTFPHPLSASLTNISVLTREWAELAAMEQEMAASFTMSAEVARSVNLLTRETACKASFNYLLLDPQVTRNLPLRVFATSDQALWRSFVSSVFYIGKGSRSRPFQHLYEAVKEKKPKKKTSEKVARIRAIWELGSGVVVVQVFHNTIAVEAFTREAALIDAVGCDNLTNLKPGDYYGAAAAWTPGRRRRLGAALLFKAFKIFLQEGERQIRPVDLRPS